jgi:type VI secretion system secreted protein VgrG
MPTYVQDNRPFTVTTPLGKDVFLLAGIEGREALSSPYFYKLDLRSENPSIDGKGLLRKPIGVTLLSTHGERHIHGLCRRFVQLGRDSELTAYYAEIVPALWFLSLSQDCRIFQEKSALEIVQQVFSDLGITDVRYACTGSYRKREYCVQYRETHLDFVSRLMEDEGIFYFFEHTGDKHTLVVADANSATPVATQSKVRITPQVAPSEEAITTFRREYRVHTGSIMLKDYDYLQPKLTLDATATGDSKEKVFDYPGKFTTHDQADKAAKLRLEVEEATGLVVEGESNCRTLQVGTRIDVQQHYRSDINAQYLVTEMKLRAESGGLRDLREGSETYTNEFVAIPNAVRFRPTPRTRKPIIAGTQTALVVGPAGEEIWVDKHGRIKVQFYWDEYGKNDENSSCWVRVSSLWAGKAWGGIHIPRMGQEVVISFLEGDPDRPLVTGRVYNADQVVPYTLPANQTQSGIKSRSSKGGGTDNFNELRFEDKKGSELIFVQAEKDLQTVVEHDETRNVGNDRTTTIKNNDTRTVKEGKDVHVIEQGDQTNQVKQGNQTNTVDLGDQTNEIKTGKQVIKVQQNQETTIAQGDQTVHLQMGKREVKLDLGDDKLTLSMGNQTITLQMGNLTTKASLGSISYESLQGIELKCGMSSVKIDQMGVTIKGMMVSVEGQIQTQVKGLMTQVSGDAMLQARGAITMIG